MAHTFLFQPAVWTAKGTLWRADGVPLEAIGRTEIAHRAECWLLSGTLKVLGSPPAEFVHAYWIEPPGPDGASMKWRFEDATFGTLLGRFAVIGESILSVYACESSGYHGAEHLGQIDADTYRTAGVLLLKDQIVYSWRMMLQRAAERDRKSTRLNSSHEWISYAVFCLKKKKHVKEKIHIHITGGNSNLLIDRSVPEQ